MNPTFTKLLLVLTMLLWAMSFHLTEFALDYASPLMIAFFRFLFGILVLVIVVGIKYKGELLRIKFSKREWWYMFLVSFTGIFLTMYFFNLGLVTTSAINASLIDTTTPLTTALLSIWLLNQKLKKIHWLGILISTIGILTVIFEGKLENMLQLSFNIGDFYLIIMVLTFALSQIFIKRDIPHIESILMTTITSIMSLFLFALFLIPEFKSASIPTNIDFWYACIFMGVLGTGVSYSTFNYCIVKLGTTASALYLNLLPCFVVLISYFQGYSLSFPQIIGGLLIVASIVLFIYYPIEEEV